MSEISIHRHSKVFRHKKNIITIRVASHSVIKYGWHRLRGFFARVRGNSYEYNDVDDLIYR